MYKIFNKREKKNHIKNTDKLHEITNETGIGISITRNVQRQWNKFNERKNKLRMMRRQADCFALSQFNLRS